jgi:hypothetical protein
MPGMIGKENRTDLVNNQRENYGLKEIIMRCNEARLNMRVRFPESAGIHPSGEGIIIDHDSASVTVQADSGQMILFRGRVNYFDNDPSSFLGVSIVVPLEVV